MDNVQITLVNNSTDINFDYFLYFVYNICSCYKLIIIHGLKIWIKTILEELFVTEDMILDYTKL